MTVSANSRRREYDGNGVTTVFNGPMAYAKAHVQAFLKVGLTLTLVPQSQYTVDNFGRESGTRVTMVSAPANGVRLILLRTMPYTQETDITNQGAFNADTIEKGFDSLAMQIQQLVDGTIVSIFDPETGQFVWDARGQRIVNVGDPMIDGDAVNYRSMLNAIEQAQTGGGVGVTPVVYLFEDDNGDGLADGVTTDFPIPESAVGDPGMYDVYFEQVPDASDFVGMRPAVDYQVVIGADPADSLMRFTTAPAAGLRGFAVLRGYSRPWAGGTPLTTTAMRRVVLAGEDLLVDGTYDNSLIVCTSSSPVVLIIRANNGSAESDWRNGDQAPYFLVQQLGAGKVTIEAEAGATVSPPDGFILETRAPRSTISLSASQDDSWTAAGDLLRIASEPAKQVFRLPDRTVLLGTNIAAGTIKDSFVVPYDFMLDAIAERGLYASLAVAQAAGAIVTIDVNVSGTSILATPLTFDNAEKTTITAATPAVFSPAFVAANRIIPAGAEVTFDVDQVGTALAKGLSVYLRGSRAN